MRADVTQAGLVRSAFVVLLLSGLAACAARTPPPALPTAVNHPEFMFPAVPQALQQAPGVEHINPGWRYLQSDDYRNATREFSAALERNPGLFPAQTGEAYVALARRDHDRALTTFDAALRASSDYVPALIGKAQTLLALERDVEALGAFEAALAADPSLPDVARRVEVLRFRNVQQMIQSARSAASAGRLDEARGQYERALATSPDSAFLYRELGLVERRQGNIEAALRHFRQAVDLDPADAVSLVQTGELLAQRQDFAGADAAYRRAAAIDPDPDLAARIAAIGERAREARLPAAFADIAASSQVTRGDLAALIGVRLEPVVAGAPARQVVMTDTQGHWAAPWIETVARAGVIDPFENHTFQPRAPVSRGDLAAAVSRIVTLLAPRNPALRTSLGARPAIADMAPGHLSYPAASVAVASGVMPLVDGSRFQVGRLVSGAEAIEAIDRLRAFAR